MGGHLGVEKGSKSGFGHGVPWKWSIWGFRNRVSLSDLAVQEGPKMGCFGVDLGPEIGVKWRVDIRRY